MNLPAPMPVDQSMLRVRGDSRPGCRVTRDLGDGELTCDLVYLHAGDWHYQPPDRPGSDRGEQGLWFSVQTR